ncbi:MAG: LysM peptidoglycan-binding domain-containing M23 family metallopeptidase [Chloroflexota bacterium]
MVSKSAKVIIGVASGLLVLISACSQATPITGSQKSTPVDLLPSATLAPLGQVVLVTTAILTPTPRPSPTPTPLVPPLPIPEPQGPPYTYHTITEGETLGYIALRYETTIEQLAALNNLPGPAAIIQSGQLLRVPLQTKNVAPAERLLPDSEVVYSPAYVDFDLVGFVEAQGGYLATYRQYVDGQELSGAEIVALAAERFSVGPRLLLALLEHYSGWVTRPQPSPEQVAHPLGPRNPRGRDLWLALGSTANRINAGYYGYKRDGFWVFELADRSRAVTPTGLNAGTVGVQNILAIYSDGATWQQELGPDGFMADYRLLFGEPAAYEPVVPINLAQPELSLPWRAGDGFYLSGGPHPAYADGSAWAAIDFGPPDVLGNCFYSNVPSTAAANGVIASIRPGEVQLDLDGDGLIQTGWVLLYMHLALDADTPLQAGQHLKRGDVIGYASCEGGLSNSSHLHLARRYNGEWIEAGGPVPLVLSGWVTQPTLIPYDGALVKGEQRRQACECWEPESNLIVNTPAE